MPLYAGKYAICEFLQNMQNILRSHDRYKPVSLTGSERDTVFQESFRKLLNDWFLVDVHFRVIQTFAIRSSFHWWKWRLTEVELFLLNCQKVIASSLSLIFKHSLSRKNGGENQCYIPYFLNALTDEILSTSFFFVLDKACPRFESLTWYCSYCDDVFCSNEDK